MTSNVLDVSARTVCAGCDTPMRPRPNGATRAQRPSGIRFHGCRGLCQACAGRAHRAGTLPDHPRTTRSRDDVLDDWAVLRTRRCGRRRAAAHLQMTLAAFERHLYRARADGDPRAVLGRP